MAQMQRSRSSGSVTVGSLMAEYKLEAEDISYREISTPHLENLCASHFSQWRLLPSHLEVESISVEGIDCTFSGERERRIAFFFQWKHMKGPGATYGKLLDGLVAMKCTSDAEAVCRMLTKQDPIHKYPVKPLFRWPRHVDDDDDPLTSKTTFLADFHPDVRLDLKQQLQLTIKEVMNHYASFVFSICTSVKSRISAQALSSYLLGLPAFKNSENSEDEKDLVLLCGVRERLEQAVTVNSVINALSVDHASFVNCDIFKCIVEEFGLERDRELLRRYMEHLQDYMDRHKLTEYMWLNPSFGRVADASGKLVVRLDVAPTMRISQLLEVRTCLAGVVGLWGTAFRLYDVEEGSIIVTFLVPTLIAERVFSNASFTPQQAQEFRDLSVMSIQYCDMVYDFTERTGNGNGIAEHSIPPTIIPS